VAHRAPASAGAETPRPARRTIARRLGTRRHAGRTGPGAHQGGACEEDESRTTRRSRRRISSRLRIDGRRADANGFPAVVRGPFPRVGLVTWVTRCGSLGPDNARRSVDLGEGENQTVAPNALRPQKYVEELAGRVEPTDRRRHAGGSRRRVGPSDPMFSVTARGAGVDHDIRWKPVYLFLRGQKGAAGRRARLLGGGKHAVVMEARGYFGTAVEPGPRRQWRAAGPLYFHFRRETSVAEA